LAATPQKTGLSRQPEVAGARYRSGPGAVRRGRFTPLLSLAWKQPASMPVWLFALRATLLFAMKVNAATLGKGDISKMKTFTNNWKILDTL
jgi:hypothetical protein